MPIPGFLKPPPLELKHKDASKPADHVQELHSRHSRLWQEKRGEAEPPDYSDNLLVQLGLATEPLNRRWFERTTGEVIKEFGIR